MTRQQIHKALFDTVRAQEPRLGCVKEVAAHSEIAELGLNAPTFSISLSSVDQVQALFKYAAEAGTGARFKTVSTGFNWGLGSRHHSMSEFVQLDCSSMRDARQLSERVWDVGPGITQRDIATLTLQTNYTPNLTASSPDTSVLGNILSRGIGIRGQRSEDLISLRAVLPNGMLLDTNNCSSVAGDFTVQSYGEGIGPNFKGIFLQSTFGVVVSAKVKMWPRLDFDILKLEFKDQQFEGAVNWLKELLFARVISPVVKIYSAGSGAMQSGATASNNTCYATIEARGETAKSLALAILKEANETGKFQTAALLSELPSPSPLEQTLLGAWAGKPGHSENMFRSMFASDATNIDKESGLGWRMLLPLIPFDSNVLSRVRRKFDEISSAYGIEVGSTINALSVDLVDLVVCMRFSRSLDSVKSVDTACREIETYLEDNGVYPYRIDGRDSSWPRSVRNARNSVHDQLKRHFDPLGLLI